MRQGFEPGAGPVSNMVMARDFWFQALESQAVTSLRFVHCRPPESSRFASRFGDILETAERFLNSLHSAAKQRSRPRRYCIDPNADAVHVGLCPSFGVGPVLGFGLKLVRELAILAPDRDGRVCP